MLENSINILEDWINQRLADHKVPKRSLPPIAKFYLDLLGFSPMLRDGLVNDICEGTPAKLSSSYPLILKQYKEVGIEMKKFQTMPLHLLFLGVEKSLISKTPVIVDRRKKVQNQFLRELTELMQSSQNAINSISISWCNSMAFSGKDDHHIGTASWQSAHYVAFTRLSLFHFGPIDRIVIPEGNRDVLNHFKRVRVVWFCLVSHLLSDEKVPSARIDHYVKLFLSSCRRLWQSSGSKLVGKEVDDDTTPDLTGNEVDDDTTPADDDKTDDESFESGSRKKSGSRKRRRRSSTADQDNSKPSSSKKKTPAKKKRKKKQKKRKKSDPFFVSGSNYLSALNLADMIDYSGGVRDSWEGVHESYIQELKRELNNMRHAVEFLVTILKKLLCTSVFSVLNEDNPHEAEDSYTRTSDLRIYPGTSHKDPKSILEKNNVVVGMVDKDDKLYVCVDRGASGIATHPIIFDDQDGYWCLNLWYSKISIGDASSISVDRKDLMTRCHDFFMFLRPADASAGTIICKSWRVRVNTGKIRLPLPHDKILRTSSDK